MDVMNRLLLSPRAPSRFGWSISLAVGIAIFVFGVTPYIFILAFPVGPLLFFKLRFRAEDIRRRST
jgi:hypothetical protein